VSKYRVLCSMDEFAGRIGLDGALGL